MRVRRRSIFEIYIDVLRAVRNEHKPSRIMHKSNLSWIMLMECLGNLADMGLITERHESKRKLYYITKKGIRILNYVEQFLRSDIPILAFLTLQESPMLGRSMPPSPPSTS